MPNIKYDSETVTTVITGLQQSVQELLRDKSTDYDTIVSTLNVSQGDMVEALKIQLVAEKAAIGAFADFYDKLFLMIQKASKDVDLTETHYQQEHVGGAGHVR